jgi:hypothetical protein
MRWSRGYRCQENAAPFHTVSGLFDSFGNVLCHFGNQYQIRLNTRLSCSAQDKIKDCTRSDQQLSITKDQIANAISILLFSAQILLSFYELLRTPRCTRIMSVDAQHKGMGWLAVVVPWINIDRMVMNLPLPPPSLPLPFWAQIVYFGFLKNHRYMVTLFLLC